MIVIGYGTGRCGTESLASFLNQQEGFNVTHEKSGLAWYPILCDTDSSINEFVAREGLVIGDVAFSWIHYVSIVLRRFPDVKVINIRRDVDEVIESFWNYKAFLREDKAFMGSSWFPDEFSSIISREGAVSFVESPGIVQFTHRMLAYIIVAIEKRLVHRDGIFSRVLKIFQLRIEVDRWCNRSRKYNDQ